MELINEIASYAIYPLIFIAGYLVGHWLTKWAYRTRITAAIIKMALEQDANQNQVNAAISTAVDTAEGKTETIIELTEANSVLKLNCEVINGVIYCYDEQYGSFVCQGETLHDAFKHYVARGNDRMVCFLLDNTAHYFNPAEAK